MEASLAADSQNSNHFFCLIFSGPPATGSICSYSLDFSISSFVTMVFPFNLPCIPSSVPDMINSAAANMLASIFYDLLKVNTLITVLIHRAIVDILPTALRHLTCHIAVIEEAFNCVHDR